MGIMRNNIDKVLERDSKIQNLNERSGKIMLFKYFISLYYYRLSLVFEFFELNVREHKTSHGMYLKYNNVNCTMYVYIQCTKMYNNGS